MEILNQFGVQPILLIAQIVNFLVLLFILKRFLYKPLLKVLDERKQKIAKSLKDAEKIAKELENTEANKEKILVDASLEARQIIEEATKSASEVISQAHEKATAGISTMIKKAEDSISLEREQMHQEIKTELADMVALALERVTGKVLTQKDQKEILQKTIQDL